MTYLADFTARNGTAALTKTGEIAAMLTGQDNDRHEHQDRVATLAAQIISEAAELARLASGAHPSEPTLSAMLAELAASERQCDACGKRWYAIRGAAQGYHNDEHRAEWSAAFTRREAAVRAITEYALAKFPATTLPGPQCADAECASQATVTP